MTRNSFLEYFDFDKHRTEKTSIAFAQGNSAPLPSDSPKPGEFLSSGVNPTQSTTLAVTVVGFGKPNERY